MAELPQRQAIAIDDAREEPGLESDLTTSDRFSIRNFQPVQSFNVPSPGENYEVATHVAHRRVSIERHLSTPDARNEK
jgi:hypothetical protein